MADETRVVGVQEERPKPFTQMGAPGFASFGGFIVEPEKDHTLTGREKYTTYSNLLANVDIVAAGTRFFLNVVSKAVWKFEPADDSKEAKDIADLVKEILHDMVTPWSSVIRRSAMHVFYGFSVQEWTAKKREDGIIGFLDVEPRAQMTIEQWDTDDHGTVHGVVQRSPQTQRPLYIPRAKIVHIVDDAMNDTPEGLGLFRHLAKAAKKLEKYELLEAWGFETDLRGTPIARAPLKDLAERVKQGLLKKEDAEALIEPLKEFIRKHVKSPSLGMVLDSSVARATGENQQPSPNKLFDVELMTGDGGPHAEIAAAIERIIRQMARILGVEHMLLGSDSKGSHALSQDKTQSFGMNVDACLTAISQQMQTDLLGPLFLLNGWDKKLMPKLVVDKAQYRDITEITTALKDLAQAGAPLLPNDPAINETRALIGISNQPDIEEVDPDLLMLSRGQPPVDASQNQADQEKKSGA